MPQILFIASNRIGDAVLSTGALEHALTLTPGASVTLACGPIAAPIFRAAPNLAATHLIEKKQGHSHWFDLWRALRGQRFDLAVDLRGTGTTYALNVKKRFVHRKSRAIRHKVLDVAATFGLDRPLEPKLRLDAKARAEAAALLPGEGKLLALGPGANFIGKRWPPDRFALLASRLTRQGGAMEGARVVLLGGPGDQGIATDIGLALREGGVRVVDAIGKLDLLACAGVLERATLFVGNDSGLMHLAAAAGAPTLGLFGPSDERVYGPWGPRARAIRAKPYAEIMASGYMPLIEYSLMEDLTVDAVEDASAELLVSGGF